eukprot:Opistho-2@85832
MAAIEAVVAQVGELKDNEMREVEVGGTKVLLVFSNGAYSALGTKCSHYGAPLKTGVLSNGKIRCPWHGACFNAATGDIEDYPGLDSLATYNVRVAGTDIIVSATAESLAQQKRTKAMCSHNATKDARTFLIVGGGPAANSCAETLRQLGFEGRIVVVTKEPHVPVDRPKLSKMLEATPDQLKLRAPEFFEANKIEIQFSKEVTELDPEAKTAKLNDGTSIRFNAAFIATGGIARRPALPGASLGNIFTLRTLEDGNRIVASVVAKNVVIIGASFIGLETAACIYKKAASVTIVGTDLVKGFGPAIGASLRKLHESNGVKFIGGRAAEFRSADGTNVSLVALSTGETLHADVVVLGCGVLPATQFIRPNGGLKIHQDGTVIADQSLRAAEGVFVGGDIARFPLPLAGNALSHVEHVQMALYHGAHAAHGMLGKPKTFDSVPFFWTMQYGKSIRYTGYAPEFDDVIVHGDADALKFTAFVVKGNVVLAVLTAQEDPNAVRAASLFAANKMFSAADVRAGPVDWSSRL